MGNKEVKQTSTAPKVNPTTELQTYIMIVQAKLTQNRNKKVEMIRKKRKDIVSCLEDNNLDIAKAKMDSLIREEDYITVFDILGPLCEILKEKVSYLILSEKCPDDLRATVDTIVYSSTRLEIDELHKIRDLIKKKYGELFVSKANSNADCLVNVNVVEKLKVKPAADQYVVARLKQLCREDNVNYEFPQDVIPVTTSFEPFNNYPNNFSGGNTGGGDGSGGVVYPNMHQRTGHMEYIHSNQYDPNFNMGGGQNFNQQGGQLGGYPNPDSNPNSNFPSVQNFQPQQNYPQNYDPNQNFNQGGGNYNINNIPQNYSGQNFNPPQNNFQYKDTSFNYKDPNISSVQPYVNEQGNKSSNTIDPKTSPSLGINTSIGNNNNNNVNPYQNSSQQFNNQTGNFGTFPQLGSVHSMQNSNQNISSMNNPNQYNPNSNSGIPNIPSKESILRGNLNEPHNFHGNDFRLSNDPHNLSQINEGGNSIGSSYVGSNTSKIINDNQNINNTTNVNPNNTPNPQLSQSNNLQNSNFNVIKNSNVGNPNPYQNDFSNSGNFDPNLGAKNRSVSDKTYNNVPTPGDEGVRDTRIFTNNNLNVNNQGSVDDLTFPSKSFNKNMNIGASSIEDLFPKPHNGLDDFPKPKDH
jgi:hypothetical protein